MASRNHDEIAASLVRAEQDGASITIRGAGFSFGGQGLPPTDDNKTHYILSTAKLKEVSCVYTATEYEVVIRVVAGVTWKEALWTGTRTASNPLLSSNLRRHNSQC